MTCLLYSVNMLDYIDGFFQVLNQPLIPGINLTWSWCGQYFFSITESSCLYLVKEFCLYVHKVECFIVFSFIVAPLSGFGDMVTLSSSNELGSLSPSPISWKGLHRISVNSSFKCLIIRILQWNYLGLEILWGRGCKLVIQFP